MAGCWFEYRTELIVCIAVQPVKLEQRERPPVQSFAYVASPRLARS